MVHHHDPEAKQESMQLKHKGSPTPKKFCVQQSARKIMATMVALQENIKQKCREKLSAGVLLFHDNAPAHKSHTRRAAIRKCGFVELNHPPYSPDLAPSDYFPFRKLKKFLCGATIS